MGNNNNNNINTSATNTLAAEENNNKLETSDATTGCYTCEFCCKSFKRPNSLRKHIIQAHPVSDDVLMSPVDSAKETTSSSNSNSPMSSPSTSVTKYSIAELLSPTKSEKQLIKSRIPCLSCSESFSSIAELSHHLSTEHQHPRNNAINDINIPLLRRPTPYIPLLSGNFPLH